MSFYFHKVTPMCKISEVISAIKQQTDERLLESLIDWMQRYDSECGNEKPQYESSIQIIVKFCDLMGIEVRESWAERIYGRK